MISGGTKKKRESHREKRNYQVGIGAHWVEAARSIRRSWVAFAVGSPSPLVNLICHEFATCRRLSIGSTVSLMSGTYNRLRVPPNQ